jgi:hypothetical protein
MGTSWGTSWCLQRPTGAVRMERMIPKVTALEAEQGKLPTPAKTPLESMVDEIRADAARDPETYVRETVVPEGGE